MASSTTRQFILPPLDGSLPPSLTIDFHLKHNPHENFAVLYDIKSSLKVNVSYQELACAVHRVAHILNPHASAERGNVVGILISTDSITYISLVLGAMRAGLVPFPISPRIPPADVAHLLIQTGATRMLVGGGPALLALGNAVGSIMKDKQQSIEFITLPPPIDLFPNVHNSERTPTEAFELFPELEGLNDESVLCILHSSGSTRTPRPIAWDQEGIFKNFLRQPLVRMYNTPPRARICMAALPMFHTMGMIMQCMSPLFIGTIPVIFAPSNPPTMPTPDVMIQVLSGVECQSLVAVPVFLEIWSRDDSAIAQLKKLDSVTYGGGPFSIPTGNKLVKSGVRLFCGYGSTELGVIIEPLDPAGDPYDWPYVSFSSHSDVRLDPQDDDEGSYELVILPTPNHKPFVLDSEYEGKPAYRTKDLVLPHPSKHGLWKFIGRLDDQIVLLNGEKTNPGLMEAEMSSVPIIDSVIMFGRGRNHTGALVEIAGSAKERCETQKGRAELVELIWPHVERANRDSPTHSRLAKDAIIIVDPSRPLPRTPKGTVSRSGALKAYASEIDNMYLALERGVKLGATVGVPASWKDPGVIERWLAGCIRDILGREVEVDGDLFQQGMDSLTAAILLRIVKSALNSSGDDISKALVEKINQRTIFAYPSVKQLSRFLIEQSSSVDNPLSTDIQVSALQAIRSMVDKYNLSWGHTEWQLHSRPRPPKERVVVTGTTGALGSYLLAQLLENEKVDKVWALNRGPGGLMKRQRASFEDKSLDVELLKSHKLALLETEQTDENLGLTDELLQEIRSSVTIFIHNAWPVNFNLNLQSFEPSIRGARNLLDLASTTTTIASPRLLFTSSISAAGLGKPSVRLMETTLRAEDAANGIGYGQSKFVVERLLKSARVAGLETCTVRLGQLTGDAVSGSWSLNDWLPSTIVSSMSAGCLPDQDGRISWLPLDVAAQSIIEICTGSGDVLPAVVHVSHPRPVEWSQIFSAFAETLGTRIDNHQTLPIVPFKEWKERIKGAISNFGGPEEDLYRSFPTVKIQSLVEDMALADKQKDYQNAATDIVTAGVMILDTSEGERLSSSLRSVPELGPAHVEKWVRYWDQKGLFG